jgi:chromosome segregation ATPase
MFMDTPQTLLFTAVGAFFLGWLVGKIGAYVGNKYTATTRDPRDDRIRSLEAELRVAKTEVEKSSADREDRDKELGELRREGGDIERHLQKSEEIIVALRQDLRDSVRKTRELREELTLRATENLKSEVKLREVETELSVAQASTDMIATGVLDYTQMPEDEEEEEKPQIYNAGV